MLNKKAFKQPTQKLPWCSKEFNEGYEVDDEVINIPSVVEIITWHDPGYKPSSEPMMVSLLLHIAIFLPQWVDEGDNDANVCAYVERWACPLMVYDSLYNAFCIAVAFHDMHVITIKNASCTLRYFTWEVIPFSCWFHIYMWWAGYVLAPYQW